MAAASFSSRSAATSAGGGLVRGLGLELERVGGQHRGLRLGDAGTLLGVADAVLGGAELLLQRGHRVGQHQAGEEQHALLGLAAGVADADGLGIEEAAGTLERGLLARVRRRPRTPGRRSRE